MDAKRAHWREGWEKFFPGGPDGPDYAVMDFTSTRIELVSNTHRIAHEPASPAPAIAPRRKLLDPFEVSPLADGFAVAGQFHEATADNRDGQADQQMARSA